MNNISTHVLDTSLGRPAAGIPVTLAIRDSRGGWKTLASAVTDRDGRAGDLLPVGLPLATGTYRLSFDTASYFRSQSRDEFFPQVEAVFSVRDADQHIHLPLLLSTYSYCTYRGS
jgi:5-hydroxyisourate hydrolase